MKALSIYASTAAGLTGGIFGGNRHVWSNIVFRDDSPNYFTGEERDQRRAHRKQIRHNRQRLINKRGYA